VAALPEPVLEVEELEGETGPVLGVDELEVEILVVEEVEDETDGEGVVRTVGTVSL